MDENKRCYLSVDDIANCYLPMTKKKIREMISEALPCKHIGRRIYVNKELFEKWLDEHQ